MSVTIMETPVQNTERSVMAGNPPPQRPAEREVERRAMTRRAKEKPRRASSLRWVVITVVALAVGVGVWQAYSRLMAQAKTGGEGDAPSQRAGRATLGFAPAGGGEDATRPASALGTVAVEVLDHSHTLRLTGTLVADKRSAVVSNASGIAAEVRVDRGSVVRKDDVLVQIDPSDAKNRLAEGQAMVEELKVRLGLDENQGPFKPENQPEVKLAKAALELAKSNVQRAADLYARKVVTTESYDQVRTEHELASQRYGQALHQIKQSYQAYQTALVRLSILQKAVADTTIRAPFDGLVVEKMVEVGEQISAGMQATKVITLVQVNPLRLSLAVPQQSIGQVREGQTVRFQVDSYPQRAFQGVVKYITPSVTQDTRSMVVEAVVENRDGALRPGLFATAELALDERKTRTFVPSGAVQRINEVARVFVVQDGVAREKVVALGEEAGGKIEIRSGLSGKEILVARPDNVRDGDPVR